MKSLLLFIIESTEIPYGKMFYHSIIPTRAKEQDNFVTFIQRIVKEGIVPHDNGEIDKVIWLDEHKHEYNKDLDRLEIEIAYTKENISKYGLVNSIDGSLIYATKKIPLTLDIVCSCPYGYCDMNGDYIYFNKNVLFENDYPSNNKETTFYLFKDIMDKFGIKIDSKVLNEHNVKVIKLI